MFTCTTQECDFVFVSKTDTGLRIFFGFFNILPLLICFYFWSQIPIYHKSCCTRMYQLRSLPAKISFLDFLVSRKRRQNLPLCHCFAPWKIRRRSKQSKQQRHLRRVIWQTSRVKGSKGYRKHMKTPQGTGIEKINEHMQKHTIGDRPFDSIWPHIILMTSLDFLGVFRRV